MSRATKSKAHSVEKDVVFRCTASDARSVFLAGTFNDWTTNATPMEKKDGGDWVANLKLAPGTYEYKFLVDDQWRCDPAVEDGQYCGEDALPNSVGTQNRAIRIE